MKRKRNNNGNGNRRSPKRTMLSVRIPTLPAHIIDRILSMTRAQRNANEAARREAAHREAAMRRLRNIRQRLLNYRRNNPFASITEMRMGVVANSIMENLNNPYTNAEVNGVIRRMRVMNQI